MFRRQRHSASILAAWLSATLLASASPGYLATVGPAPLRFQPPPPTRPVTASAAPIPVVRPITQPTAVQPAGATPSANPPPSPAGETNEWDVSSPPKPEDVVSPQMLLKYFNHSTNGTGTGIIMPLNLTPPSQAAPPSSKATYSN